MIESVFLWQFAIGLAVNVNAHDGMNTAQHDRGIFLLKVEKEITKDVSGIWVHSSEYDDGFNHGNDDRDYLGLMWNF